MTEIAEKHIMKNGLSPAKQNAILSTREWMGDSKVKLTCTHHTEPLLRAAGVTHPKTLASYIVEVCRDKSGFLVLNLDSHSPQLDGDSELYESGGIFYGMERDPVAPHAPTAINREVPVAFADDISAAVRTRRFEIATGDNVRVRVEILTYQDDSLPSPGEPERWSSKPPTDAEIQAAIAALRMARDLANYEK